jgi:small subunit ribosomal protein S13
MPDTPRDRARARRETMVRIAGVDVPDGKRVNVALRRIYGIGPTTVQEILQKADIDGDPKPKVTELSDTQVDKLREIIDKEYTVEGDLRQEVTMNIRRLIEIGSFRGLRHRRGLPARGQRTRTNARTRKGPKRTVAGRGRRTGATKK